MVCSSDVDCGFVMCNACYAKNGHLPRKNSKWHRMHSARIIDLRDIGLVAMDQQLWIGNQTVYDKFSRFLDLEGLKEMYCAADPPRLALR